MKALHELGVREAARGLRRKAFSSTELTRHMLRRIEALDPLCHSFVAVMTERAFADADRADVELASGHDRGALHGVPYALKDMIDVAGMPTTCGSRLRLEPAATADAAVAARLKSAGGVLLGKLATYEFATVGPSFDAPFPPARNPRQPGHITGGSSSGNAAAAAAGLARITVGTDSGGSLRSPACYCGVVGLKPTFGLVPLAGVQPLSPALDHAGPLAATVADAAYVLDALCAAGAGAHVGKDIKGLRIAYGRNWSSGAEAQVQTALDAAASLLMELGAQVEIVGLPDYDLFDACGTVILQAEAFALHHASLARAPDRYGRKAFQNLVSGAVLNSEDIAAARRTRATLTRQLEAVMARYDALLTACTLAPAPPVSDFADDTPRWTAMRTLPFNVTGHPALAVPMGETAEGLPLGLQLAGKHHAEAVICRIGAAFEAASPPHLRFPAIPAATGAELS